MDYKKMWEELKFIVDEALKAAVAGNTHGISTETMAATRDIILAIEIEEERRQEADHG